MKNQVCDCVRSPWSTIAHLLMRYVFAYSVSEEWSAARLERAQRIIRTGIASVDRCPAGIQHDEPAYRLNVGCVWLRAEVSFLCLISQPCWLLAFSLAMPEVSDD